MKKIFNKLDSKPLLLSVFLIAYQSVLFLIVKVFQNNYHLLSSPLDQKIPFVNYFILIYCFWYFLIFYLPYFFYKKDKDIFYKYITSYVLSTIISSIIFIIYPTEVIRPTLDNTNIFNILTNIIYFVDTPAINCLPSMHCAISMLFILSVYNTKKITNKFKFFILISSLLIMLSTLFVKQHVIIDLISGNFMMILIYFYVSNDERIIKKCKKILRV